MIKMLVTKAVISKGFEGNPALRFSENAETPSVRFRIGVLVYDKRADREHRFVNINVKAFGYLVDRIKNMKLDAGTCVNIMGRFDEDIWEDQTTHEKKSAPVLIVDEIEFGTNGKPNGEGNGTSTGSGNGQSTYSAGGPPPESFTGFEGLGETNPFFPN